LPLTVLSVSVIEVPAMPPAVVLPSLPLTVELASVAAVQA
jgi:hypothetical protein